MAENSILNQDFGIEKFRFQVFLLIDIFFIVLGITFGIYGSSYKGNLYILLLFNDIYLRNLTNTD